MSKKYNPFASYSIACVACMVFVCLTLGNHTAEAKSYRQAFQAITEEKAKTINTNETHKIETKNSNKIHANTKKFTQKNKQKTVIAKHAIVVKPSVTKATKKQPVRQPFVAKVVLDSYKQKQRFFTIPAKKAKESNLITKLKSKKAETKLKDSKQINIGKVKAKSKKYSKPSFVQSAIRTVSESSATKQTDKPEDIEELITELIAYNHEILNLIKTVIYKKSKTTSAAANALLPEIKMKAVCADGMYKDELEGSCDINGRYSMQKILASSFDYKASKYSTAYTINGELAKQLSELISELINICTRVAYLQKYIPQVEKLVAYTEKAVIAAVTAKELSAGRQSEVYRAVAKLHYFKIQKLKLEHELRNNTIKFTQIVGRAPRSGKLINKFHVKEITIDQVLSHAKRNNQALKAAKYELYATMSDSSKETMRDIGLDMDFGVKLDSDGNLTQEISASWAFNPIVNSIASLSNLRKKEAAKAKYKASVSKTIGEINLAYSDLDEARNLAIMNAEYTKASSLALQDAQEYFYYAGKLDELVKTADEFISSIQRDIEAQSKLMTTECKIYFMVYGVPMKYFRGILNLDSDSPSDVKIQIKKSMRGVKVTRK
jgi:hypothetical protein